MGKGSGEIKSLTKMNISRKKRNICSFSVDFILNTRKHSRENYAMDHVTGYKVGGNSLYSLLSETCLSGFPFFTV